MKKALKMMRYQASNGSAGFQVLPDAESLIRQAYNQLSRANQLFLCTVGLCAIEGVIAFVREHPDLALALAQSIATGENWWLVLARYIESRRQPQNGAPADMTLPLMSAGSSFPGVRSSVAQNGSLTPSFSQAITPSIQPAKIAPAVQPAPAPVSQPAPARPLEPYQQIQAGADPAGFTVDELRGVLRSVISLHPDRAYARDLDPLAINQGSKAWLLNMISLAKRFGHL